jgi:hypothetical protein
MSKRTLDQREEEDASKAPRILDHSFSHVPAVAPYPLNLYVESVPRTFQVVLKRVRDEETESTTQKRHHP